MKGRKVLDVVAVAAIAIGLSVAVGVSRGTFSLDLGPKENPDATWAIINAKGEVVGSARFLDAYDYGFADNGLAAVEDPETGGWGYIRTDGSWAIEPVFAQARNFSNGYAEALDPETDRWGYIDESGEWAIEPAFDSCGPFLEDGVAQVTPEHGGPAIWIDTDGNEVEGVTSHEPHIVMDETTGLEGVQDDSGAWVVEPAFDDLTNDLYSDYMIAQPQGSDLWGVVDASGEWVVQPEYAAIVHDFDTDELAVMDADTGLWGYIDFDGEWMVEPTFAHETRMSESGYALAELA